MKTQIQIRVAAYPRVSDPGLKDSKTLDSQEKEIRRYVDTKPNYILEETHIYPEAHTAYNLPYRERKILMQVLAAARRHEFDVLVVTEYGRLSRRQVEQAVIISLLEECGVRVESVTEQFDDSPVGKLMMAITAYTSEMEREKIYWRTNRGRRDRVEDGNLTGQGIPMYGYAWGNTKDYNKSYYIYNPRVISVDEQGEWTERRVIDYMGDEVLRGVSCRQIAFDLTRRGIPTRRNKPHWHASTVHDILTNRNYTGDAYAFRYTTNNGKSPHSVERNEEEHIKLPDGVIPPIISRDKFEAIQRQLTTNAEQSTRNNKYPEASLLRAGHVRCSICKHVMSVQNYGKAYGLSIHPHVSEYSCKVNKGTNDLLTHHSITMSTKQLDSAAWHFALKYIRDPFLLRRTIADVQKHLHVPSDTSNVDKQLADIRRRLKNLFALAEKATDADTLDSLATTMQALEKQKRGLEAMLAQSVEQDELQAQLIEEITTFETWTKNVRPLLANPEYEPTYEEKRLAVRILGIQCVVYPKGTICKETGDRYTIELAPPNIVSVLSQKC